MCVSQKKEKSCCLTQCISSCPSLIVVRSLKQVHYFFFASLYSVMLIDCFSSHLSQNPPCPRFDNWHWVCSSLYHHSGDTCTNWGRNSVHLCKNIGGKNPMNALERGYPGVWFWQKKKKKGMCVKYKSVLGNKTSINMFSTQKKNLYILKIYSLLIPALF